MYSYLIRDRDDEQGEALEIMSKQNLLTVDEYERLRDSGMMYEFFPTFEGEYNTDMFIMKKIKKLEAPVFDAMEDMIKGLYEE